MNKITRMFYISLAGALTLVFGYVALSPMLPLAEANVSPRWEALPTGNGNMSRLVDAKYKVVCYKSYPIHRYGEVSCINY